MLFFLFGLMLPPQVVLIPTTVILRHLHLMFTYWGVILNFAAYYLPFGVFVFSGFLLSRDSRRLRGLTFPFLSRLFGELAFFLFCSGLG